MGVRLSTKKTKNKEGLKLLNHINSYLFEQECGELSGNAKAKTALKEASKALSELVKK